MYLENQWRQIVSQSNLFSYYIFFFVALCSIIAVRVTLEDNGAVIVF